MGALIALGMGFGALGYGAAALRALGVDRCVTGPERLVYAVVLGTGLLCWLAFFWLAWGWVSWSAFGVLVAFGWGGLVFCRGVSLPVPDLESGWDKMLVAGLAVILSADVLEALAPVADADTVAYHLDLPRRFIEAGHLFFVPFAVAGASALMPHMGYAVALGLGGEQAFAFWSLFLGWSAVGAVGIVAARFGGIRLGLIAALLFSTTPVVIYGAGTGQVETKLAAVALLAVLALLDALNRQGERGWLAFVALSGLLTGMYPAGKYVGLLFLASLGLFLLIRSKRIVPAIVFGAATSAIGTQWYVWNYLHSGDPFFPLLYGILPYVDPGLWSDSLKADFATQFFGVETPMPRTLWNWLLYPFQVTLVPLGAWEGQQAGLGPAAWLLFPFAILGFLRARSVGWRDPLVAMAIVAVLFYLLWFFIGSSQRVRHLLPVYPLLLIPLLVWSWTWVKDRRCATGVVAAIGLTLGLQVGMLGVASVKYARFALFGESREAYLRRNVNNYEVVAAINDGLPGDAYLLMPFRDTLYLVRPKVYLAAPYYQASVELRPGKIAAESLWRDVIKLGITHIIARDLDHLPPPAESGYESGINGLIDLGCAERIQRVNTSQRISRTLPEVGQMRSIVDIVALRPETCSLAEKPRE